MKSKPSQRRAGRRLSQRSAQPREVGPPPELEGDEPPVPMETEAERKARHWRNRNRRRRLALRSRGRVEYGAQLAVDYRAEVILHRGEPFELPFFTMRRGEWMDRLTAWLRSRDGDMDTLLSLGALIDEAYPFLPCGRAREQPIGAGLGPGARSATPEEIAEFRRLRERRLLEKIEKSIAGAFGWL